MKIASLIPSGTDIACSLGLKDHLVGVSHACDHPVAATLPVLTRSVIDSTLSPQEIDTAVNEAVNAGQSLYQTNKELLRQLAPDVVLTQTICDVCAVNANQAARDLPPGAQLLNLAAVSLEGLWEDLRAVAEATGTDAEPLILELQSRVEKVRGAVANLRRPRVLVIEWTEPPFLGGHWVPEIVEIAGGRHLLSRPGQASRRATWKEIEAAEPEIVILAPCGYDLEETIAQGRTLLATVDLFRNQPALPVWATNATALFSRCTPATVTGLEVLAAILHPQEFGEPEATAAERLTPVRDH